MKKSIITLIALTLVMIMTGTSLAASYTLPEKMHNQLSIGSGLKGTFMITAEGEKFKTPFLNAVTDAELSIRGISSGQDLHYYVFQEDAQEQASAVSELYRKDGVYYFRSDMVQGKVLAFPTLNQYIEALFPARGENGSASSFISGILSLPEEERTDKWDPVLTRYQNELEMWLADFTVNADTVKLDTGFSALDFIYEIPSDKVNERIVKLFGEIASDKEASALLDSVMTEEEKKVYLNGNLLYFYEEALKSLDLEKPLRISKRVSAMGELLLFSLELPLDERTTGFRSLHIETIDNVTVYTLSKAEQILQLAIPSKEVFSKASYEQSVWFARINTEAGEDEKKDNIACRADIRKTNESHEEDDKMHETDHYSVTVTQDTRFLPQDTDLSVLPECGPIGIEVDLHYSSKYAQNSATTLDVTADVTEGDASLHFTGVFKTAAPWLFMPFEVIDPSQTGTEKEDVLIPYLTDWISNAVSMIHHNHSGEEEVPAENPSSDAESVTENSETDGSRTGDDTLMEEEQSHEAETQPLDDTEQE